MTELPLSVSFDSIREFFESIGIDVERTWSVRFDFDEMTVEQLRADPLGRPTFGTVTTTIPYLRTDQP